MVNNDIDINVLGKRLKFIRKKEKRTQENIASLLNTTHSTWSAYENCKVLIPTVFIWKFATEYKCSVDWLVVKSINLFCFRSLILIQVLIWHIIYYYII